MTTTLIVAVLSLIAAFILQGYRKIPSNPSHVGQLTKWGKKINGKSLSEGWNFLPLYPLWYGYILINMERKTFTVIAESTRTPDLADSKTEGTFTFRPIRELLCNYIDSGKEEGVKKQLYGKIEEKIREWAMNPEGGPSTWIELNQSKLEAVSVLVTKIAKNSITEIPEYAQTVPTWIWLRYYSQPKPKKFLINENDWAENDWEKVKIALREIESTNGTNAVENLKIAVKKRREEIEDLRTGNGKIIIDDLGIVLERLNIGNIDVLGEVAKHADQEAKEEMERKAEALEVENILKRVSEFMAAPYNFSSEAALEAVLVNMGKIPKTISENKFSVSSETLKTLQETLPQTLKGIFELFTKNGGNK